MNAKPNRALTIKEGQGIVAQNDYKMMPRR
jgi:hypothetical protein